MLCNAVGGGGVCTADHHYGGVRCQISRKKHEMQIGNND